jgi:hypothetical protein
MDCPAAPQPNRISQLPSSPHLHKLIQRGPPAVGGIDARVVDEQLVGMGGCRLGVSLVQVSFIVI